MAGFSIDANSMAPGLGRLAAAISGGGNRAFEQARQGELQLQSKLAQALASARHDNAQAAEKEDVLARRAPDALQRSAMLANEIPLEDTDAVSGYLKSGQLGGKYAAPGDGVGPTVPRPSYAGPGPEIPGLGPSRVAPGAQNRLGDVARAIAGVETALTVGDKNVQNIAKAGAINRESRLSDAIIAGTADRNRVGGAQAAAAGKDLFNADSTGSVLDRFTGNLDTSNPMAGATINLRTQQANQAKAGAAENYAQAAKAREETARGARSGDIKEVVGPDGSVYLVNKVTGITRQVVGPDGKPLVSGKSGGAGTGAGKPMTESQAKANLFGGRMTEAGAILNELEDAGVFRPGNIKGTAETVVGFTPFIGDKLADAAGTMTNWTQSGSQQRVEQARRDFINAVLRRESGAVISAQEFANADKQYFPQPNDTKEQLAQKRRAREIATTLMLQEVPEHHRYKRQPRGAGQQGGAAPEGSWAPAAPAGANGGWKIERVN